MNCRSNEGGRVVNHIIYHRVIEQDNDMPLFTDYNGSLCLRVYMISRYCGCFKNEQLHPHLVAYIDSLQILSYNRYHTRNMTGSLQWLFDVSFWRAVWVHWPMASISHAFYCMFYLITTRHKCSELVAKGKCMHSLRLAPTMSSFL